MPSFPDIKGQKPGVLVTVRIKSSVGVLGNSHALLYLGERTLDEVEQTLTFLADLCGAL